MLANGKEKQEVLKSAEKDNASYLSFIKTNPCTNRRKFVKMSDLHPKIEVLERIKLRSKNSRTTYLASIDE